MRLATTVLLALLCFCGALRAQHNRYVSFRNIETKNFGAESVVYQTWLKDGSFLARTENGLLHHNGYSGTTYEPSELGMNTILSESIVSISNVDSNEIWISYMDTCAITHFNPATSEFKHFYIDELTTDSLLTGLVVKTKKDHEGQLWLLTWGSGLIRFNQGDQLNKTYIFVDDGETSRKGTGKFIKDMVIHEDNTFFVTFFHGPSLEQSYPCFFNPETEEFNRIDIRSYTKHLTNEKVIANIMVASRIIHWVHQDKHRNYWLGSYSGLLYLDMKNQRIDRIIGSNEDPTTTNLVNVLQYVVSGDQLWISTLNQGVMVVDMNTKEVNFHYSDPVNSNSLYSNKVSSISKDPFGNVWISNGTGILSVYVPFIHNFKVMYWKDMELEYSNRSAQNIPVNQLYVANSHEIYVSSKLGLLVFDYHGMKLKRFHRFKKIVTNRGDDRGAEHFKVRNDTIFLSLDNSESIFREDLGKVVARKSSKGRFMIAFRHDSSIHRNIVIRGHKQKIRLIDLGDNLDQKNILIEMDGGFGLSETFSFVTHNDNWIFSEHHGRFVLIDPADSTYKLFSPSRPETYFPDSTVVCVLINPSDEMYVGTKKGLYTFNEVTYEYEDISDQVGLSEDEGVNSMVKDDEGRIWMALRTELLCWDPESGEYQRYGKSLGVDVSSFLPAIGQKDELGNLYFASMYGILIFHPDDVKLPDNKLELELSNVNVNTKELNTRDLNELMAGTKEFHWTENFIEFYFHTNQVFQLSPHKFHYKLVGLNDNWVSCGTTNHVRFDNLQYGDYELLFKATNAYGVESEVHSIPFKIRKPFWLTWWFYTLIGLSFLLLVYLGVKRRMTALRKRSELLEKTVEERTAEVVEQKREAERQKAEAEHQKELVEEKQKEITDSITYAKRIQDAILPSHEVINTYLPDSFVMYRPKDIVAGDFYWLEPLSEEQIIFAAADCTGHGVPGAMVSVVCNNALNRTVREFGITDPGKLLDSTRELVIDQFEQTAKELKKNETASSEASSETIKDGMDISLCRWDKKKNEIYWAGANNPIWLIRDGELQEIKGNKQPVGKFDPFENFTTHTLKVQPDDRIYLFSDGYADQFGGEKGKKFKSSSLKKFILLIHQLPMNEQLQKLNEAFDEWKGDYEQLDDVCVIGVKV